MAGTGLEWWTTLCREELQRRVDFEMRRGDARMRSLAEQQVLDAARERLAHWRTPTRTKETGVKKKAEATPAAAEPGAVPPEAKVNEAFDRLDAVRGALEKKVLAPAASAGNKAATVEELVAQYNEMVLTGVDLGLRAATTKSFPDVRTGQLACERLHAQIEKARVNPPKTNEETNMTKTAKKATKSAPKSAPKKAAAKAKPAAKKAAAKANGSKRAVLEPNTMIVWTGKDNPFREGSGKHERVECVRTPGRASVKTILAKRTSNKATTGTIRWCINHGHAKAE